MNFSFFVNTPAQVHFYRNIASQLKEKNHNIKILARNYGETIDLLDEFNLEYITYSHPPGSKIGKIVNGPRDVVFSVDTLREFKPDIVSGFGLIDSFTSFLLTSNCVVFNDSEPMVNPLYALQFKLFLPFTNCLLTPSSFRQHLGYKHLKIESYKELSYLHPNQYEPDDRIYEYLDISRNEEFVLLRFNAFDAVHDSGITGFSLQDKIRLVNELEKYGTVFISEEGIIPDSIKDNVLHIPKNKIHDVLFFAKLFITDTQTMATESALLGTPTVRCNQFVGVNDMGNFVELEQKYNPIYNFKDSDKAITKALSIVQDEKLDEIWEKRRLHLLEEKIDIASFMVWFFEQYPVSLKEFRNNPNVQFEFQ
jgi:hypothetical protein